jgi:hypothetical protein
VLTQVEEVQPGGIFFTALLPLSATKTFPTPSTATPYGKLKPPPTVSTQLEETQPLGIFFTALWAWSAR